MNRKSIGCLIITLIVSVTAVNISTVLAATYYVAPYGSDSNDGSLGSPWATLLKGIRSTGAGDTVYMRNGEYSIGDAWLKYGVHGGSNGQYWTVMPYPGEEAVITSGRVLIEADYVRVKGLHFMSTSTIDVRGKPKPEHIEILDNTMEGAYNVYAGAINVSCRYGLVQGNILLLENTGSKNDHGIYFMDGGPYICRNNYIYNSPAYGIHVYDEKKNSSDPPTFTKNVIIENNFISGSYSRTGIIIASGNDHTTDSVVIRNNIIINNSEGGIAIKYGRVKNVWIYNNTFYNQPYGISAGSNGADIRNIYIKNNIFSQCNLAVKRGDTAPVNITIDHNLVWPANTCFEGVTETNTIKSDPLFVSSPDSNFHLQESSPAIDAGTPDVRSVVKWDYDGISRPQPAGGAYDIGAYEYRKK